VNVNPAWFITGTDTGIGKTTVAVALLDALKQHGTTAVGLKPVASGCLWEEGVWVNEDVRLLHAHSHLPLTITEINPYAFEVAMAPHLAAAALGEVIAFAKIKTAFESLRTRAAVVIEGAGGFLVPLGPEGSVADCCSLLQVPIILVVGMRLGCLNHALLTVEAIQNRSLTLMGWVANRMDPHMTAFEENLATLKDAIAAPCLGVVPYGAPTTESRTWLNLEPLLK